MRNQALGAAAVAMVMISLGRFEGAGAQVPSDHVENQASELGEVVVTARRVEESAQRIPVAITAFSRTELEERHITTGQDLLGMVPSLVVTPFSQTRDIEMFAIRGQNQAYGASPAVAQYMAEVPLISGAIASVQGTPGQFLDLKNVQVLRGPQGTLFGRNTTGGAILLEPARPTEELSGSVQLQAGNYQDREIQAVVNVPLSEKLQVRVAGAFVDRGGFTRDIYTGVDYDNRHYWTGRLGILWKATDKVENYLMVSGANGRNHGTGWVMNAFNTAYIDAALGAYGGCAAVGFGTGCALLAQLADAQNKRGPRSIALGPTPPSLSNTVKGWSAVDQLRMELSDSLTLRNILSYGSLEAGGAFDGDGTPLPWYNANLTLNGPVDKARQFTEELQILGSALDRSLTYTGGLYYESVKTPAQVLEQSIIFMASNGIGYNYRTSAKAIYTQLGYEFGKLAPSLAGLKLNIGGRYTWDSARGTASFFNLNNGVPWICANGVPGTPTGFMGCALSGTAKSSSPNWTVGLDYSFNESVLGYAKVSRGYKRGGINLYAVNDSHRNFQPEYVTTSEIGFKTTFRTGGVPFTFSADVFRTKYNDIQVSGPDFNPASQASGAAVFNAGSATLKGVEAEGRIIPVPGLEFTVNYSHLQGAYHKFSIFSPFGQFDCSGNYTVGMVDLKCIPMNYLPDNQFSIMGRYTLPLSADVGKISLASTYAYTGPYVDSPTMPPQYNRGTVFPSIAVLNLALDWNDVFRAPVDVGFFVTNATDKVYKTSPIGTWATIGVAANLYGEPRMYGVQLRYRW